MSSRFEPQTRESHEQLTQPPAQGFGAVKVRCERVIAEKDEMNVVGEGQVVDAVI